MAQYAGGQLREEVFLEHLKPPFFPLGTDLHGHRCHGVLDKTSQALTRQLLLQGLQVSGSVVLAEQLNEFSQGARALCTVRWGSLLLTGSKHFERFEWQGQQAPRPVAFVHEPFDQTQARYLLSRVEPLAVLIPRRDREAVSPLPYPQNILRKTDVAFDRRDGELKLLFHFVLDKSLTSQCAGAYPTPHHMFVQDKCDQSQVQSPIHLKESS